MALQLFGSLNIEEPSAPLQALVASRVLLDKYLLSYESKTDKYCPSEDHAEFLVEFGNEHARLTDSVIAVCGVLNDALGVLPTVRTLLERSFRVLWASYGRWCAYWSGSAYEWWSRWKPTNWEGTSEDTPDRRKWWDAESARVNSLHPYRKRPPDLASLITELRSDLQDDQACPADVRSPNWIPEWAYQRVFKRELHPAAHGDIASLNQEWNTEKGMKKSAEIVLLASTCYCHAFLRSVKKNPTSVYQDHRKIATLIAS